VGVFENVGKMVYKYISPDEEVQREDDEDDDDEGDDEDDEIG
jgi:hypothetical protein